MCHFQHWSVVAARCSAAVAPPLIVVGGEGVDQAGNEGRAKLGDGVVAPSVADEGAINPWEQSCGSAQRDPPTEAVLRAGAI